jgi:AMMECR1 domain-containing protein
MTGRSLRSALPILLSLLAATAPPAISPAPVADARTASPELDAYRVFVQRPEARRLLAVARNAMERYWEDARTVDPGPAWPDAPVGVYLSLVDRAGTRACVGNSTPYRAGLSETVRTLAIESLQADRRRPPVRREELATVRVVIAFAGLGERVADPMDVDPGTEGLRVTSGSASMAFLPGEARTVSWALQEAKRVGVLKADGHSAEFHRFAVVTLSEPIPPSLKEDPDAP